MGDKEGFPKQALNRTFGNSYQSPDKIVDKLPKREQISVMEKLYSVTVREGIDSYEQRRDAIGSATRLEQEEQDSWLANSPDEIASRLAETAAVIERAANEVLADRGADYLAWTKLELNQNGLTGMVCRTVLGGPYWKPFGIETLTAIRDAAGLDVPVYKQEVR